MSGSRTTNGRTGSGSPAGSERATDQLLRWSINLTARLRPVGGPQRLLVGLAERRYRDRVGEVDALGAVVGALALLHERRQLRLGDLRTRPAHDDGLDRLAPLLIRDADDRGRSHAR